MTNSSSIAMPETKLKGKIRESLSAIKEDDPRKTAQALFGLLGYSSDRTLELDGSPQTFIDQFPSRAGRPATKLEKDFLTAAKSVHIVFQVTDEEIRSSGQMNFLDGESIDMGHAKSFLFVAVRLNPGNYARGKYAGMTREINKRLGMPTVVLFTNGDQATFAFVHRRMHKNQSDRDVLGKVSLIRNVDCNDPHRAHLDILSELSLGHRLEWIEHNKKQKNFDGLLAAWLAKLDTEELNKRFYKELLGWFEWAVATAKFPCPANKPVPMGDHIIRLITRILFVWFIKEKDLVAKDLFIEERIRPLLKQYHRDNDDYYRAILQNLFFATLNTEIKQRRFSEVQNATHRNFSRYRYKNLLANPTAVLHLMNQTPFINGGLFDCLDSEESTGDGGYRLDCFSDNKTHRKQLSVPNRLFFDEQRGLFPLLNKYKFTVEENTPIEQEVALDPELLGKVFENLLAAYNPETRETARRQTGSYYTPRAIVDYMVNEALVASLAAQAQPLHDDAEYWRERLRYLLDYEDAFDDAKELFEEEEVNGVVKAISDIKVLDPAVGSGAFPMGVLHKLSLALRRIDPDNNIWESLQKSRARKRASAAFDTADEKARDEELLEISETFENYRDSDFGRKLYLIQNSIFGVDIQPIACQIAKLRFFISLAIEQNPNKEPSKNFGIKPLPNLETRFVAADTLIGLRLTEKDFLDSTAVRVRDLEEKLRQNRERHFNAGTRRKKLACAKKDKTLRCKLVAVLEENYQRDVVWNEAMHIVGGRINKLDNQIADCRSKIETNKQRKLFADGGDTATQTPIQRLERQITKLKADIAKNQELMDTITQRDESIKSSEVWGEAEKAATKKGKQIHTEAQKISAWDPYDQNARADWFDLEWMYGVRDGFNIVIGNPPYTRLQKDGGKLGDRYQSCGFRTFDRTGDIYQLFYEKSTDLLTDAPGVLAFITSNSWMRAQYGKKLREFFSAQHSPLQLIDMGKDAFDAIVDTNILLASTGNTEQTCKAVDMDTLPQKTFPPDEKHWVTITPQGAQPWSILSPLQQSVKDKMERLGTPLKDWDIQINYGIKTGYNEAFIIDSKKRDKLITADPKSAEIIKPIFRGRDIKRYQAEWAGCYIIIAKYESHHYLAKEYPSVFEHLKIYKEKLRKRGQCRYGGKGNQGQHHWLELDNNPTDSYLGEFAKEKLFWMDLTENGRFSYESTEMFCINSGYIMSGKHIKYLCAILNSNLVTWFMKNTALNSGMGVTRWVRFTVEKIPIPEISTAKQRPFIRLVDSILSAKAADPSANTDEQEAEIDRLVYELYDLTADEINAIG